MTGVWQARRKGTLPRLAEVDAEIVRLARGFLRARSVDERTQMLHGTAQRLADRHELELSGDYKSGPR